MTKPQMSPEDLTTNLAHFTGTQTHYKHGMFKTVLYTDGVQFLAEQAGAYWLVDIIAIAQRYKPRVRAEAFQVWQLKRTAGKNSCVVTCEDGKAHVVYRQCIPFTDFPLDTIKLYYCGQVIQLPSEY